VVLTGPLTGVRQQVTGHYAERLHRHGSSTLAFDHRGFGESGGRRAHEDSQGKLADLRAAVGRIGVVGVCLGGGYAVRTAAADPRIAAASWENRLTRGSLHSLMTFDALGAASLLGAAADFLGRHLR
jgi:dienelactone hydrolase